MIRSEDVDALKKQSAEELRALAVKYGVKVHHKAGQEKLVQAIVEHMTMPQVVAKPVMDLTHPALKVEAARNPVLTQEDVLLLTERFTARRPEFSVTFPDDNSWHFKYKGAEDSGSMDTLSRVIVMKAETVARGRVAPRGAPGGRVNGTYGDTLLVL